MWRWRGKLDQDQWIAYIDKQILPNYSVSGVMCAFVGHGAGIVRAGRAPAIAEGYSGPSRVQVARVRVAPLRMSEKKPDEEEVTSPFSLKDEKPELTQSLYGIVVFGVTIAIFGLGLYATFARSFLPGGLAPPV